MGSAAEDKPDRLVELRGQITEATEALVRLLDHRGALALAIGQEKLHRGITEVRNPGREAEVLDHAVAVSDGTVPPEGIRRIVQVVMDVASEQQVADTGIRMGDIAAVPSSHGSQ